MTEGSKLCCENWFGILLLCKLQEFASLTCFQMVNHSREVQLFYCIAYVQIDLWTFTFTFNGHCSHP